MSKNFSNHSLFVTLQKLQAKLAVVIVKIRAHSYRSVFKTSSHFNMASMLADQVDELALSMSGNIKPNDNNVDNQSHSSERTFNKPISKSNKIINTENIIDPETEFSKHLKERKHSIVSNRYIGDKLQESVWEHIHSAIRYARQGDVDTAKFHSKLAASALDESGHYLNNEDYSDLVYKIQHYFSDANKDK